MGTVGGRRRFYHRTRGIGSSPHDRCAAELTDKSLQVRPFLTIAFHDGRRENANIRGFMAVGDSIAYGGPEEATSFLTSQRPKRIRRNATRRREERDRAQIADFDRERALGETRLEDALAVASARATSSDAAGLEAIGHAIISW